MNATEALKILRQIVNSLFYELSAEQKEALSIACSIVDRYIDEYGD